MNSLISAGFTTAQFIEPEPPESWRDNPRTNDAFRIPDFIVLLCKKAVPYSSPDKPGLE